MPTKSGEGCDGVLDTGVGIRLDVFDLFSLEMRPNPLLTLKPLLKLIGLANEGERGLNAEREGVEGDFGEIGVRGNAVSDGDARAD